MISYALNVASGAAIVVFSAIVYLAVFAARQISDKRALGKPE